MKAFPPVNIGQLQLLMISCVSQILAAFFKTPVVARKRKGRSEVPIVPGRVRADLICSSICFSTLCLMFPGVMHRPSAF